MAEIMDGKEVRDRLPIPLTVVTKNNVGSVEPAGTDQERMVAQRRNLKRKKLSFFSDGCDWQGDDASQQKYQQNISVGWFCSRMSHGHFPCRCT
ncbi:hypothetical protein [Mesorhizobium sp. B3-2-1]|uniref:hypothetical protein n=1 Tax=Mesorhizobium sp. B3-2-1 TaxID=2589891 RepID=UPI0015E40EA8|nr:hypothetical protein [Mesorhizobium sp. B3-2-1]